ncbi:hypothetical protein ACQRIT_007703 [Beauveria bassiana]
MRRLSSLQLPRHEIWTGFNSLVPGKQRPNLRQILAFATFGPKKSSPPKSRHPLLTAAIHLCILCSSLYPIPILTSKPSHHHLGF